MSVPREEAFTYKIRCSLTLVEREGGIVGNRREVGMMGRSEFVGATLRREGNPGGEMKEDNEGLFRTVGL